MNKLTTHLVLWAAVALGLPSPPAFAMQDIANRGDLVQALDAAGIKIGAVVWLKVPMGDLPGLSKVSITDADIRSKYEWSRKRLVLLVDVEGKGNVEIELSKQTYLWGNEAENFYFRDPSKLTSRWGKRTLKAISEGQVLIGMTEDQVTTSWGNPSKINSSGGRWGRRDQWVFGDPGSSYLYFENGRLSSWQN